MFRVAFVFVTLVSGPQAFGQRAQGPRNPCEELPAVMKRCVPLTERPPAGEAVIVPALAAPSPQWMRAV